MMVDHFCEQDEHGDSPGFKESLEKLVFLGLAEVVQEDCDYVAKLSDAGVLLFALAHPMRR